MPKISKKYVATLVDDTMAGDSNAFAVLYAASYEWLYKKSYAFLKDEYKTQDALFSTYLIAYRDLHNISKIGDFVPWIDTIHSGQLLRLLKEQDPEKYDETVVSDFTTLKFKRQILPTTPVMSIENAGQLLESIFLELGVPANDVPLETLKSYHTYRTNKFTFQWAIIAVVLLILLMLPLYLIPVNFTLTVDEDKSDYSKVTYDIDVDGFLPINVVTASLNGKDNKVTFQDVRKYTTEVTENGELSVTVKLYNTKTKTLTDQITRIDKEKPVVVSYQPNEETVEIYVEDAGSGIDYENVTAVNTNGDNIKPTSYNAEAGLIVLPYPAVDTEVTIPDVAGNILKFVLSPY